MAAPFPGPTAEQGAWVAIAEQGARADSGDHGGSGELWQIRGLRGPWQIRVLRGPWRVLRTLPLIWQHFLFKNNLPPTQWRSKSVL